MTFTWIYFGLNFLNMIVQTMYYRHGCEHFDEFYEDSKNGVFNRYYSQRGKILFIAVGSLLNIYNFTVMLTPFFTICILKRIYKPKEVDTKIGQNQTEDILNILSHNDESIQQYFERLEESSRNFIEMNNRVIEKLEQIKN